MTDFPARKNEDTWFCPRRGEGFTPGVFKLDEGGDTWRRPRIEQYPDDTGIVNAFEETCSYCGSISGHRFMELVRLGVELGPTDKSYKVYWTAQHRDHTTMQVTRVVEGVRGSGKFYFPHLTIDQRREFVDLYNDLLFHKKPDAVMRIGIPGRFYSLPFFMGR